MRSGFQRVGSLAVLTLGGFYAEPHLFAERAADETANAVRLPLGRGHQLLQQMCSAAVSTLGKVMVDPDTPASTRVRAADSILNHSAKAIEIEDIEARVAALEAAAGNNGARR